MVGRTRTRGRLSEWVFRHCSPDHTELSATLVASRSAAEPSRFNVPGEFGAVYVACEVATALAELDHRAERLGLTRRELLPRAMLTLELVAEKVLDLTDPAVREAWGLSVADLSGPDYSRCQEVARAARDDGYEAILYPSARGSAENFAVFLDRLKPGSHLVHAAPPRPVPGRGDTL